MRTSEDMKEIAKALSAFQAECPNVVKSAFNPFYNSHYADLESIWNTVRRLLNKHGLSIAQGGASCADKRMKVTTLLMHTSGQFIEATLELSAVDVNKEGKERFTPQTGGIAMTYGRRYGLSAMLGIASEEDTDGNGQSHGKSQSKPKAELDPALVEAAAEALDTKRKEAKKLASKMSDDGIIDDDEWKVMLTFITDKSVDTAKKMSAIITRLEKKRAKAEADAKLKKLAEKEPVEKEIF